MRRWVGLALFASGITIEMYSEETRKAFKKDPRNKGKVDDTGLFGIVFVEPHICALNPR